MSYKDGYKKKDDKFDDYKTYEDDYDKYDEYENYGDYDESYKDYGFDECKNEYKDDYEDDLDYGYEEKHCDKLIEVDKVLGFGSDETFVEACIPLCPPAFEVIEDLIEKKIVFDALVAGKDKVFVNGRLIKNIPYKTKCEVKHPCYDKISKLVLGNIKHATAEIPFALCIKVPGSEKGGKVVVLKSKVNSIEILNHYGCVPNSCVAKCEPFFIKEDTCLDKPIRSITEKDCIFVKVKVVKPSIIKLPHKQHDKY